MPRITFIVCWVACLCQGLRLLFAGRHARASECVHCLLGPWLVPRIAFIVCWAPRSCQPLRSLVVGPLARRSDCVYCLLGPPPVPAIAVIVCWPPRSYQGVRLLFVGARVRAESEKWKIISKEIILACGAKGPAETSSGVPKQSQREQKGAKWNLYGSKGVPR